MDKFSVNIVGSGTSKEIAAALIRVANQIIAGDHVKKVEADGECEWEDSILATTIELDDEV